MPELPEVETTALGIKKYTQSAFINQVCFFRDSLRYPLNHQWINQIKGQTIQSISRRAKVIVMVLDNHILLWHLGMTGSLRVTPQAEAYRKHDHIEFKLDNHKSLRFHDPRRFGYLQLFDNQNDCDEYLKHYGPEPLSKQFTGEYLWQKSRNKKQAIKSFIMNQSIVVGVGNIYACEALFLANISPSAPCGKISKARYNKLVINIKTVLEKAIKQGGTTLNDFENADAKPGYFQQSLLVYGKNGENCTVCNHTIKNKKIAQRSSFYCSHCQKI